MTQAFVYKWTHLPTLMWYVGSRTKQGCHPQDGYICSSKSVEPMIIANPEEWSRTIIATGEPKAMRAFETEILELFDAVNDSRSFNRNNGNGKFGMTGQPHTEKTKYKIREANLISMNKPDVKEKLRQANLGKKVSMSTKEKLRISHLVSSNRPEILARLIEAGKKPQLKTTCPHCGKVGGSRAMTRYHFSNCIHKDDL
jgi:hypothetical protein